VIRTKVNGGDPPAHARVEILQISRRCVGDGDQVRGAFNRDALALDLYFDRAALVEIDMALDNHVEHMHHRGHFARRRRVVGRVKQVAANAGPKESCRNYPGIKLAPYTAR
jgi:hypothetical protein